MLNAVVANLLRWSGPQRPAYLHDCCWKAPSPKEWPPFRPHPHGVLTVCARSHGITITTTSISILITIVFTISTTVPISIVTTIIIVVTVQSGCLQQPQNLKSRDQPQLACSRFLQVPECGRLPFSAV